MHKVTMNVPRVIADRIKMALQLYGIAKQLRCEWAEEDRGEELQHYEKAGYLIEEAANEIWEAAGELSMLNNFEELEEEEEGGGKEKAQSSEE